MTQFLSKNEQCILFVGLLAIFFFKLVYVFLMTDYSGYLTSDALGYWVRADERYAGREFVPNQWNIFPPFYHLFLAKFFTLLNSVSLLGKKLEAVLFLNIVLSTASSYALYMIAKQLSSESPSLRLFALYAYGFFYPITYLNAYVLSENLATPALIFSLYALMRKSTASLAVSALFLAVASATRSNIAILFIPFCVYLFFYAKPYTYNLKKIAIFAVTFVLLLSSVVAENYRISNGKLTGLSMNGGLNLAFAMCRFNTIRSDSHEGSFTFGVAAYGPHPEYGTFISSEPFSNQAYYIEQAKRCISQNPYILIEKLKELPNIFIGPFYPTYYSAKWIRTLLPAAQYGLLFMTVVASLLFWLRLDGDKKAEYLLLLSIPALSLAVLYIFNLDQRLVYPFAFSILLVFALSVQAAIGKIFKKRSS